MQKLYMKKFNGDISNLAMLSFDNNTIIEIEQDKVKEDDRDKVVLVSDTGEYEVGYEVVKELPREFQVSQIKSLRLKKMIRI